MIEQGIVLLLNGTSAVTAIAPIGGFNSQLPPNATLPTWTFTVLPGPSDLTLSGPTSLTFAHCQVNCYGENATQSILLANAIDRVLDGYASTLPDPDDTIVQVMCRANRIPLFDDDARNYHTVLDYELQYVVP